MLVGCLILYGCMESDYTKLVKSELTKTSREDSLLLGIYFGDSRNEFYKQCFALNKKKLVAQGPSNAAVQYNFKDSIFHDNSTPIRLLFYPRFDEENILNEMDLEFSYAGWAPWNRNYQSDKLLPIVKKLLVKWYGGNSFIYAHLDEADIPVKLDANRRIVLYTKDTQTVVAVIQDILHPKFKHSID